MRHVCAIFLDERFVFSIALSNENNNEPVENNILLSKSTHKEEK
jgi:hypothetical protein